MKINFTQFKNKPKLKHLMLLVLAFVMIHGNIIAQSRTITGTVKDSADNTPIIGASVVVKGTTTGVMTDANGNFTISAPHGSVLSFSIVGYQGKEVEVTDQTKIDVVLPLKTNAINEVVVTALGVRKEKSKLGYSVQDVKGKELVTARDANPLTGLTGKVAGLSVGASPELLGTPTILMRGDPISLYVVDGVPINSDTWNISPDDIESITVLKGATAAALYGSRAANGAILITTKKRTKDNGVVVEFNSTNSFDKGFLAFPRQQFEYGGGENELYAFGDGRGGGLNDGDYDVWGPKFRGQLIPQWDGEDDPNTTYTTTFPGGSTWTGNIKPTPYIARGVNNLKNFLQTGIQTNDNLSVTRTGENYSVRASFSQSHQQGIVPNTELNISNFNIYGSINVTKRLSVEGNFNYNRQYTPNIPDVDYGPNSIIYNIAIWTGADWNVNDPKIRAIWQPGKVGTQSVFCEYQRYHNPWFMSYEWLRGHYKTDYNGYTAIHYKLNDHLNVNLRTQVTGYDVLRTEKMPFSAHPYGREENMGDYREDRRSLFDNNTDLQLNFDYPMGNFLNLAGLVGGNIRAFSYNSSFTSTDYLIVPEVYNFSNSLNPLQVNNFQSQMQVLSAYMSLDADLGKYATVSLTGREDKSTAILVQNATYFYPSVSVASVVSHYVKLPDVISYLKLRASFADVREVNTGDVIGSAPFNTITALGGSTSNSILGYALGYGQNYLTPYGGPTFSTSTVYSTSKPYNNEAAATSTSNLVDPNLKPSVRDNYEGGFDVEFLHNRLGLSATVFDYIDGPQILQNPISTETGYSYDYINALKLQKLGLELSLSGTPVQVPNGIKWDVLVNWSTFKQTYLELPQGQNVYNTFFHKGDRVDKLYATDFVRTKDGQIINVDGEPIVNPVNQFLGNENGDFTWSFNNKLTYKQLSFGFQFDGNVGGVMIDYMHLKTMRGGNNIETVQGAFGIARENDDANAGSQTYQGTYVGPGVEVSNGAAINYDTKGNITNYNDLSFTPNTTPALVQEYVSNYYNVGKANLMSKTYAKLREVTIGYDLPAKWLAKSIIKKATVSLVGRNLLYIYGDKRFKDVDLDQYNAATSESELQTPTLRRFGFNINVIF